MKFLVIVLLVIASHNADATLSTSAAANMGSIDYSYNFTINDVGYNDNGDYVFTAELTNTSASAAPVIASLAFNTFPDDLDVSFGNFSNGWRLTANSRHSEFMYLCERDTPKTRLGQGDSFTFDIVVASLVGDPNDVFLLADSSFGRGIGGGDEYGQVAAHFQSLENGNSDLLVSNWETSKKVPEPMPVLLLGIGLLIISFVIGKKTNMNDFAYKDGQDEVDLLNDAKRDLVKKNLINNQ